jgi:hypothetical protein
METVTRTVGELPGPDRSAFERVVGHVLHESQRLVLNVYPCNENPGKHAIPEDEIPEHWKVYDGLSDAEIDALDAAIRVRANFTRSFE